MSLSCKTFKHSSSSLSARSSCLRPKLLARKVAGSNPAVDIYFYFEFFVFFPFHSNKLVEEDRHDIQKDGGGLHDCTITVLYPTTRFEYSSLKTSVFFLLYYSLLLADLDGVR